MKPKHKFHNLSQIREMRRLDERGGMSYYGDLDDARHDAHEWCRKQPDASLRKKLRKHKDKYSIEGHSVVWIEEYLEKRKELLRWQRSHSL